MAEHHRSAGIEAQAMRHVHDFEPVVAHGFERRNSLTDTVHKDFSTAARDRSEAGGAEIRNDFFQGFIEHLTEMDELAGAETMDVKIGKLVFNMGEHVEVPLFREFRMMAALHEHLGAA